jgi:hypothetical protein
MFLNQLSDPIDFLSTKSVASFDPNRFKPELNLAVVAIHMDMWRLIAIASEKEEPKRPVSQHSWHAAYPTSNKNRGQPDL